MNLTLDVSTIRRSRTPGRHRAPGPARTDVGTFSTCALTGLTTVTMFWMMLG